MPEVQILQCGYRFNDQGLLKLRKLNEIPKIQLNLVCRVPLSVTSCPACHIVPLAFGG